MCATSNNASHKMPSREALENCDLCFLFFSGNVLSEKEGGRVV